jgi:predicted flavoprotein YhiN
MQPVSPTPRVAVIGGGPAGLMAAETLARGGVQVSVFDAMPSVARKFLLAGRGGLNLTHAEAGEAFLTRYGSRRRKSAAGWRTSAPPNCAPGPMP